MKRVFYILLMCACCMACTQSLEDMPETQSGGSIIMQRLDFDGNLMKAAEQVTNSGGLRVYSLMPASNNGWEYTKYYDFGYVSSLSLYRTYMTIGRHKMYIFNTPTVGCSGYDSNEGYGSVLFPEMPDKHTELNDFSGYYVCLNKVKSREDDGLKDYAELESNALDFSNLYFPPYDLGYAKTEREVSTSTEIHTTLQRVVAKLSLKVKFSNNTTLEDNQIKEIVAVVKGKNKALSMEDATMEEQKGDMLIMVGDPSTEPSDETAGYALAWDNATKCDTGDVLMFPNLSGASEAKPQIILYLKSTDGSITALPIQLNKKFEAGKQNNVTISLKLNAEMKFQVSVDGLWEEQSEDIAISDKYELNTYSDSESKNELSTLMLSADGAVQSIYVKSNTIWSVESPDADWITIRNASGYQDGSFEVSVSASPNTVVRMGEINVTYGEGGIKKVILVEQAAAAPVVTASAEIAYLPNVATPTASISYSSNASVEISIRYMVGDNWLTLAQASAVPKLMGADSVYRIENGYSTSQAFSLSVGCTAYTEGNHAMLYLTTISGGEAVSDSVEILMGDNAIRIYENGTLLENNEIYVGYGWQVRRMHIQVDGPWRTEAAVSSNSNWMAIFPQSGTGDADIWVMTAANNDYNNYLNDNINFPEGRNADMKFSIYDAGVWRSSTTLKVYQDAAYQSILTDVTTLEFPWNQTFGRTSYTIKQNIQVLACTRNSTNDVPGNNNAAWTAEVYYESGSGTGWLHTNVLSGNGPGVIECYCDDNNSSSERSAQIRFTSLISGAQVRKVVYISQNAKRAGDTRRFPVAVRYFEGSSSLGHMTTSGSGNWTGYSLPSFYMATYELTTQAYCDFLNDIGISSSSIPTAPSGSYVGSINADYKDVAIDKYPYVSTDKEEAGRWFDNKNISFGGDFKWTPATGVINDGFAESINASSLSGSYANYSMTALSWCGAYEYAYWMNYYAQSNSVVPQNDVEASLVMTSEAMWEYAARGGNGRNVHDLPIAVDLQMSNISSTSYTVGSVNSQYWTAWYNDKVYGTTDQPLYNLYGRMPVGLLLKGENGTYDMVGNAGEWCFDWYSSDFPYNSNRSNPHGSTTPLTNRVYRGGVSQTQANVQWRGGALPVNMNNENVMDTYIGFRPSVQIR